METVDGRRWATREELIEHSGFSAMTLKNLWRDRESNGHPPARKIGRSMHWDLEAWEAWFARQREQSRDVSKVDRSGDPDEELSPVEQARLLGVAPARITQYDKNPPPGWPQGRAEQLANSVRHWRTRRQLWEFADTSPGFGTRGGRPPGPAPEGAVEYLDRQSSLKLAAALLKAHPDLPAGEAAQLLAETHGRSPLTWIPIVREARRSG